MNAMASALVFLINSIANLFIFILIIRCVLVWIKAHYFNPVTQFVVRMTDWLIKPTRRIVPNFNRLETASLLWIMLIELAKLLLISSLLAAFPGPTQLIVFAMIEVLKAFIQTFIFALIFAFILSWLQPFSPLYQLVNQFVQPILRPFQRLIPPVAGIDISPIPALLILQCLLILLGNV